MIYFVACPPANAVKIGHTRKLHYGTIDSNAYSRMASMQSACPFALEMLAVCEGDLAREQELHRRFRHLRLRGEWFLLTEEVREFISGFHKPIRRPRGYRYPKLVAA